MNGDRFAPLCRQLLGIVGVLVVTVIATRLLLDPPSAEWPTFAKVFGVPVLVALVLTPLVARWVRGQRNVGAASLVVGLCSLAIGVLACSGASRAMFVSSHDYRLFMVMMVLASGIAIVVAQHLASPIARDIRRLGAVAQAVADGDLTQRTTIVRRDEIGQAAEALDRMVLVLAEAQREREALAGARQHLLSSVSHDLRTPLAALRATVESLRDGLAADPPRYLSVAERHLTSMEQLLDHLHQFARIESGMPLASRMAISLSELADETVDALLPMAERSGVSLEIEASTSAMVDANPGELSRVLRNLLDNAIRHAPQDGRVTLRVEEDSSLVRLQVLDTGPGFPDEFRAIAFEPFTRADEARSSSGSSGLGLAIAKALVEAHGGTIALGPGPGGAVIVELPRRSPVAANAPRSVIPTPR